MPPAPAMPIRIVPDIYQTSRPIADSTPVMRRHSNEVRRNDCTTVGLPWVLGFFGSGGWPPPGPVRCSAALRAHFRADPPHDGPIGDGQLVHVREIASCNVHFRADSSSSHEVNLLGVNRLEVALAPSNPDARMLWDVRAVVAADRPITRG